MPQLGAPPAHPGGLDVVRLPAGTNPTEIHRNRERERMNIPDEPEAISETSLAQQVYVYNAGPWTFVQTMGSMGQFVISGLEENESLKDLNVAGPLVIPGIPKEYYPAEGESKVIYHSPRRNMGKDRNAGYDFAMEMIGVGMMQTKAADLRPYGVFVSKFAEVRKPTEKNANWDAYRAWEKQVREAQDALRRKCSELCQEANVEYSRGRFSDVRNDQLYQAARLINGTELQYSWLKDTGEKADNKSCLACGTTLKAMALKCSSCGTLQVSPEEFDAEIKKRQGMTL